MCVGVSVWLVWSGIRVAGFKMFRTLIYPSSGACDYSVGRIVLGPMYVGVSVWLGWSGIRVTGFSLPHGHHSNPATPKLQHTSNQKQYDQCGNSTE